MASEEQLSVLKQGVKVWNEWRNKNLDIKIDLSYADLIGSNLREVNLNDANLSGAKLSSVNLSGANLMRADLSFAYLTVTNLGEAHLNEAQFNFANLSEADLKDANFSFANLKAANLSGADLIGTNLSGAQLSEASLSVANIREANLKQADFYMARFNFTVFAGVDLSEAKRLDDVRHLGPSTIGTDTIAKSKGQIPNVFLSGCGLSDWEIEQVKLYNPNLSNDEFVDIQNKIFDLRQRQAIQIFPLFISYSHDDNLFVDKLDRKLKESGIRFWRDIHNLKAGRIEKQIDKAIRKNPTVVLVLSKSAQESDWVEHEVRTARELEKELGRDVLCPVALDDSWKSSSWPKRVMEQIMEFNILDFSEWNDDSKFDGIFRKLIDGLELFYKG